MNLYGHHLGENSLFFKRETRGWVEWWREKNDNNEKQRCRTTEVPVYIYFEHFFRDEHPVPFVHSTGFICIDRHLHNHSTHAWDNNLLIN